MDKPKIRLLADRILVSVQKKGETKIGSLIIPDSASEEAALQGDVLRVSKRVSDSEVEEDRVLVGDTVLFSKFAGSDVIYNMKEYKILRITDIFGVVEDED